MVYGTKSGSEGEEGCLDQCRTGVPPFLLSILAVGVTVLELGVLSISGITTDDKEDVRKVNLIWVHASKSPKNGSLKNGVVEQLVSQVVKIVRQLTCAVSHGNHGSSIVFWGSIHALWLTNFSHYHQQKKE